jgi:menaquinone-9 beta-reductase
MESGLNLFDLIVIGAGPGGSAAAIRAARAGATVLLLERGSFPRHKVCGEFVSAESLGLLANLLQRSAANLVDGAIRIDRARLFLDGQIAESAIQPAAASIARFDLDAALWQAAAECGVHTSQQVTVTSVEYGDPLAVISSVGDFRARAVVDATGRWSNLSSRQSSSGPKWLGIKGHFCEARPSKTVDLYFFDGGYCGVQPVDLLGDGHQGARINACAMVRADRATDFPQIFTLHPELKARSKDWQPLTGPVATSPLVFRRPTPVRDGMLLVGDAAGFVDPFVGDGISLALRSGAMAAECLTSVFSGKAVDAARMYADRYQRELGPIFRTSSALRRMLALPPAIRKPALVLFKNSSRLKDFVVSRTRRAS